MEENAGKDTKNRKDSKSSKDDKTTKTNPKTTGTKLKERWLLTRKTWRYMSDAGKKLFPEGTNPNKKEDIPKLEEHFQEISERCGEYVLWDPNQKRPQEFEYTDTDDEGKGNIEREEHACSLPGASYQNPYDSGRERLLSTGELGWGLPTEIYNQLLRSFGASTLHRVASKLLEEQLMEEDEFDYDEDEGELVEIEGRTMRSIGSQTDPYLDMSVQTDHDANAEDFVKVGAETRAETEAAVAQDRALVQEQLLKDAGVQGKSLTPLYQQPMTFQQLHMKQSDHHSLYEGTPNQNAIRHQIDGQPQDISMQHISQQQYDANLQQYQLSNQQSHATNQSVQTCIQPQHYQQPQQLPQDVQSPPQQQSQPPVLKKFWARRESLTAKTDSQQLEKGIRGIAIEKDKEPVAAKSGVAAKLASLEAITPPGGNLPLMVQKPETPKLQDKKKQNVFKLGLKCDIESQQGFNKVSVEKAAMDKFKTVNYDKTLRNIKSKWVPTAEEEEYIRALERDNELERERVKEMKIKEKERIKMKEKEERLQEKEREKALEKERMKEKDKEKKKKKARSIQVGDPLPQFILNSFRINSPVQIIHATRRRLRRFSSKAESISGSESSVPPSGMISPRFSICILDDQGTRDLNVSEAEAYKLSQMGIPFVYKRSGSETALDIIDLESGLRDPGQSGSFQHHQFQRSLSAVQASGHLTQLLHNLRTGRLAHHLGGGSGHFGGRAGDRAQKLTHSLLQYLLPTVMQRSRGSGGGHASRLVAKRIWRTRSKSQSRASAGTTSIWTPMGNCTWMSVTGRVSTLDSTSLHNLSELERLSLSRISLAKLQALNLGCQVKVPKESTSSTPNKKRRPYLLKRKALSTGFFENKKEESKGTSGGFVFGLSLTKCLENERVRGREAAERETLALVSTGTPSGEEGEGSLSRKSSQAGSHASFTSLLEGAKQSTTGSLESLNLERKRPSLGGGDVIVGSSPTSLDLLTVDPQPQVPSIVSTCCRFLEDHGLHTLGIFRVSSSKKRVRQLREEFDSGKDVMLTEENCPHDVATLLKEFFRDLPEPLLTRELYEPLLCTQKIRNRRLQLEALQYLIQLLPLANRDTLYSLLNFLTTVAEHASDTESEVAPGNKMDSSNLATLFAPNILHQMKPGSDSLSTSEMTTQAEERMDVINVVRSMIDHNKELFEVTPELLDETYQHLMDTHPEALDTLLRRRCTGSDELDLEIDTSSSVFDGSDASSPLPRSPTDHLDFEKLRAGIVMEDLEGLRREAPSMQDVPLERTRRRRRNEEEESQRREKRSSGDVTAVEERGWFRRREKSGSRELERGVEPPSERTRWFRRREKNSSLKEDKGSREKVKDKGGQEKHRERIGSQDSIESQGDRKSKSEQEKLKVPEPSVRRLSSPEIDNFGVIIASLKIPVPLQQHPSSLAFTQETDIPYIEDMSDEAKLRLKDGITVSTSRQRTGSNDSFLGQTITGSMSFQPLSKKDGDKQSHDSVISSSSMGIYTMSPSERNTPSSDFHYASGTSTPNSGVISPPMYLSPDSGTPGLSPPNSPPPQRRRSRRREEAPTKPNPLTHSATHTFGVKPSAPPRTRDKARTQAMQIGRSRTSDIKLELKLEETAEKTRASAETRASDGTKSRVSGAVNSSIEKDATKKYTRRRYTAERHHTGHLPDISSNLARSASTESSTQLWKRWEIIASDPTEPETFV